MSFYHSYSYPTQDFSASPENSPSMRGPQRPAPYTMPTSYQQGSRLQLLTTPLNPNLCLYGPPPSPPLFKSHPEYSSPVLPPAPAPSSQPLSTSPLPRGCFEEFIIPPPFKKNYKPNSDRWGGDIDFLPIPLPNKLNRGILGTPMRDCLQGYGLKEPDGRFFAMLAAAGKTHFDFMIRWPGYPHLDWVVPISIYGSDGLVTKRELAHRLATQYRHFTMMCDLNQFQCHEPRWRVGPGSYTLDRMRLSTLRWVEGDIWEAYVCVLTDRDVDPNGLKSMRDLSRG